MARQQRLEAVGRSTAGLLTSMDDTVRKANAKVLLNPFDSPKAVQSSHRISTGVLEFRSRLGIESGHEPTEAKRWRQAVLEARDAVLDAASDRAHAAKQLGDQAYELAAERFRSYDADGDVDESRAVVAAEEARAGVTRTGADAARSLGTLLHRRHA